MTYNETINFLYSKLPMFHRVGSSAFQPGLLNIDKLCKTLGNPYKQYKTIHVAGTNGKGSVSHMLASILQHAGYKTGLYTSPHLLDFRERIKVNGMMIPEEYVVSFVRKCSSIIDSIEPSFFELTTAMAFEYFAELKVDIAVIETGLGGRLDSTNVITPELSVITNVSFDHTDILGDTLEKIANEKAGIIKAEIPVVIGETDIHTKNVFLSKAKAENTGIAFADQQYSAKIENTGFKSQIIKVSCFKEHASKESELDLLGIYQQKNLPTVLASIDILLKKELQISQKNIEDGLKSVINTTGLFGRWQILCEEPLIVADTGHNEAGLSDTMQQLQKTRYKKLHIVFGLVKEKDIKKILKLLPVEARYYFTKADIPRALDENLLAQQAMTDGLLGNTFGSVSDAIDSARAEASINDAIYIGGSTFIVGEALRYFKK